MKFATGLYTSCTEQNAYKSLKYSPSQDAGLTGFFNASKHHALLQWNVARAIEKVQVMNITLTCLMQKDSLHTRNYKTVN